MKVAYLILAHTDPQQFDRLLSALQIDGVTDFYVHIDKKTNITVFMNAIARHNVSVCKSRMRVFWGGYNMCMAIMELLKTVVESGVRYDRVFLLSGLDYPIKSNRQILDLCELESDKQFIQGYNITKGRMRKHLRKIMDYHFFMDFQGNQKIGRFLRFSNRIINRIIPLKKDDTIIVNDQKLEIFYASQWWGLTFDCVKYVYGLIISNPKITKYFKYSFAPDELLIPTLVLNSPFAKSYNFVNQVKGLADVTYNHVIDYGCEMRVMTEEDYERLINSDKIFFRKARTGVSDTLMDMLDSKRKY